MSRLYRLPNGKVVDLYGHPTFAPVLWCKLCRRMVSKWHEHYDLEGKPKDWREGGGRGEPRGGLIATAILSRDTRIPTH